MVQKRVLIAVTDGSEEIEVIAPLDILRRADVHVTVASCAPSATVHLSQGVRIVADAMIDDVADQSFDCIVLPGGEGSFQLAECQTLVRMLKTQEHDKRWIGAICNAPFTVLQKHGLLDNRMATCFPTFADRMPNWVESETGDPNEVVISKRIITSVGPGTAIQFGLALTAALVGRNKADEFVDTLRIKFTPPSISDLALKP